MVSSLITERAAKKVAIDDSEPEKTSSATETEKILVALNNPNTIEDMVNLSLVIRDPKLKDNLLAINVINNDNTSDNLRMRSKRYPGKSGYDDNSGQRPVETNYPL